MESRDRASASDRGAEASAVFAGGARARAERGPGRRGDAPARAAAGRRGRRVGQDARHHLPAGAPGRDRRRPAPHPGGHLHQQGRRRAARARRQAALGSDGHRHARALGRDVPRDRGAHPAPVGRDGRPAQGLRHLRRRRSEAAAGARADRPQGARADVPGAPGAVRHRSRQEPGHERRRLPVERLLRRRRRQGLPPVRGAAGGGQRDRLRRPAAVGAEALSPAGRPPPRRSRSASTTCWSTSSRTPTACSTGWCACCRGARTASPSSATRTSRSTAGAAPTSATSSTSSATTRARAS